MSRPTSHSTLPPRPWLCLIATLCLTSLPQPAAALPDDLATRWKVNDEDPMANIPSIEERNSDPMEFAYFLQDMVARAEGAYRRSDWKGTIKYYRALSEAVPKKAISYSRMCHAHTLLGHQDQAIKNCRAAMALKGAKVLDHLRFVDAVLRKPELTESDVSEVEASLSHLRDYARLHPQALPSRTATKTKTDKETNKNKQAETHQEGPADAPAAARNAKPNPKAKLKARIRQVLEEQKGEPEEVAETKGVHLPTQIEMFSCRLAVLTGDDERLVECSERLHSYDVPEEALLPFHWAHALHQKNEARAETLLGKAQSLGLPGEVLDSMRAEHAKFFGTDWPRILQRQWLLILVGALMLGVLGWIGFTQASRMRRQPSH